MGFYTHTHMHTYMYVCMYVSQSAGAVEYTNCKKSVLHKTLHNLMVRLL